MANYFGDTKIVFVTDMLQNAFAGSENGMEEGRLV